MRTQHAPLTARRRGFTILELVAVLVALAALVAIIIPTYQRNVDTTADRVASQTLKSLATSVARTSFAEGGSVSLTRDDVVAGVQALRSDVDYELADLGEPSTELYQIAAVTDGADLSLALLSASGRCVTLNSSGNSVPDASVSSATAAECATTIDASVGGGGGGGGTYTSPVSMTLNAPPPLIANPSLSTGGWSAVTVEDRIYGIARRTGPGDPEIACAFQVDSGTYSAGDECPGYPANFTASGPGEFSTSYAPDSVVIGDELWVSAARETGASDQAGVYCWNLEAAVPCDTPWYPLDSTISIANHATAAGAAVAPITGVHRVGDRLYMGVALRGTNRAFPGPYVPATAARFLCFNHVTKASCGTVNVAGGTNTLPGWNYSENRGRAPTMISTLTSGGRLYFVIDHGLQQSDTLFFNGSAFVPASQYGNRVLCLDTNTDALCSGFGVPVIGGTSVQASTAQNGTSMIYENPLLANQPCFVNNHIDASANFFRITRCLTAAGADVAYGSATFPTGLADFITNYPAGVYPSNDPIQLIAPVMFDDVEQGTKRYMVFQVDQRRVDAGIRLTSGGPYTFMSCYDHATNSPCAGFGTGGVASFPSIAGGHGLSGNLGAFSLSADSSGCLWVLGDYGNVTSVDPSTGTAPCGGSVTTAEVSQTAADAACGQPSTLTYTHAALSGTDTNPVSNATLTVSNGSGPVSGFTAVPFTANAVDLTALPAGGYTFEVTANAAGTWATAPTLAINFMLDCGN